MGIYFCLANIEAKKLAIFSGHQSPGSTSYFDFGIDWRHFCVVYESVLYFIAKLTLSFKLIE